MQHNMLTTMIESKTVNDFEKWTEPFVKSIVKVCLPDKQVVISEVKNPQETKEGLDSFVEKY